MTKVLVFGAFDGLHPGHLDFFRQAKKFGDWLIVSVGTDENVERIKGKRPLFSQKERMRIIGQLRLVDEVVAGAKKDYYKAIKNYNPDVICLGYDQWASVDDVRSGLKSVGLSKITVVRLKPYRADRAKSTHLKNRSVDF
ncbi:FAD synthase [Candidatus Curtissbacteria bacterium]|nr:FAD synthase [Candidatus Curtissbacteria bacterium]